MTLNDFDKYLYSKANIKYEGLDNFIADTLQQTFMFEQAQARNKQDVNKEDFLKDVASLWIITTLSMLSTGKTNHHFLKGIKIPDGPYAERLMKQLGEIKTKLGV